MTDPKPIFSFPANTAGMWIARPDDPVTVDLGLILDAEASAIAAYRKREEGADTLESLRESVNKLADALHWTTVMLAQVVRGIDAGKLTVHHPDPEA